MNTVLTESKKEKCPERKLIKPSQLPIYETREDLFDYEYQGKEKTEFDNGITIVREELQSVLEATKEVRDAVGNFVETGKAHSLGSLNYIRDEENLSARVGLISASVLTGFLLGFRRGFFKKSLYGSILGGGAAAICYPNEAIDYSKDISFNATEYATIAYNFVTGVKPKELVIPSNASTAPKYAPVEVLPFPAPKSAPVDVLKPSPPPAAAPTEVQKQTSPTSTETPKASEEKPEKAAAVSKDKMMNVSNDGSAPNFVEKVVGDLGQGNPADQDMYTTRGGDKKTKPTQIVLEQMGIGKNK